MKKIVCIVISFLLILQGGISIFAASTPTIYADAVSVSETEITLVPLKIKNNSGLMGFRITLEYPSDKVDIKSISRSEITSKGNFISNLGDRDGIFDVVWNNIDNISEDGTLFVLEIQSKSELASDEKIKLTYNQQDTFNSSYKDVSLVCENILLKANASDNTQNNIEKSSDETGISNNELNSSQIVSAVNITLNENGYSNLSEVKDIDDFVDDFNKNLEIITGTDNYSVSSFDEIVNLYKTAYESDFIKEIEDNIDYNDINSIIKNTLSKFNANTTEDISNENKAEFVKDIEIKLKEKNSDTPEISVDLSTDDAVEIIAKLYDEKYDDENNNTVLKSRNILIFAAVTILIILSATIFLILKKRKNQNDIKYVL